MPSYVPPKKNTEYIFYVSVVSQADGSVFQSNPTIAAGDFKVSTDGGALGNPATLPVVTPASSKMIKVTLSTSEMNGDNVTVVASDAAGGEWCDAMWNIQTSTTYQLDDIVDEVWKRDMSAITGEAARSPLNAIRFLRNKWTITGTTLSVKEEDDSTEAWSSTVTTNASADPITENDPA